MGEIPHSEKMFHLPIEVSVYVPSTQDVDKVVSKSEMKLRVEEVKKYLATLFGGFSSSSVEGGFLASDGKVVKENVERVVSFAEKTEFDKNKEALVQKASEWAAKWGQEAIGLEHEGDLYYVPQKFENGGTIAIREAKEMANSQAIELKHHASELANVLKKNPTIEAWVIAKLERASNDLSDVTHYLDGRVQMSGKKMATGGNLSEKMIKVKAVYLEQQYFELTKEMEIPFSDYKEYDKTGKVPRELEDDLMSETTIDHWVETNSISVRLTPVTADKMATGGNTSKPMQGQIKIFDEQETSFISHIRKDEFIFQKISISKNRREEDTTNVFSYKSYDSMLNAAKRMANDKSTILIYDETGKGEKYLLKDYFNKSAQVDDKMATGGGVSSNESQSEILEDLRRSYLEGKRDLRLITDKEQIENPIYRKEMWESERGIAGRLYQYLKKYDIIGENYFIYVNNLEKLNNYKLKIKELKANGYSIIEKVSAPTKDKNKLYRYIAIKRKFENGGNTTTENFDNTGTSIAIYHEEKGNFMFAKGLVYLWLYEGEGASEKLESAEYDYVLYPISSLNMSFQKGFIPPLKRIWTKKFQDKHKGSQKLLGAIKAHLSEDGKELYIDMMSVNPTKKKKGIMSYMIKHLRDTYNLTQDQITFSDLTKEGESFVSKKKYADGGNILLAPNGKPSKLTPEQYKLVRTPEFKAWFGDWESDPKNASKVVDEDTKEPLVVYHGSNSDFNIFEKSKTNPYAAKQGYFFAFNKNYAESYNSKYVKPFFINIRIEGTFDDDDNIVPANADGNILQGLQVEVYDNKNIKLADGSNTTFDGSNPDIRFKDGGSVGGREGNNSVLKSLFNNPEDITPIKFNGKTVGGIDVTTYRGDTETLRVHHLRILPEFQGKGIGAKAINKLFRDNPNVKQIIGNATAESKSFWQKIGAEFHSNEHTAFTITRKPNMRFDAGGNMEFERPSYQSNYVASQAQANEIADDKWNMDYENDPLIKAQKKAKEIAKKVKETAKRAAMAYATKGMSETNRQTNGAAGGASEGGDEMSGANKMDMASMFKGMK